MINAQQNMDLIYTLHRKPLKCAPPTLESLNGGPTLCTISTGNIAAFTSLTQLQDDAGHTWGSHVYVCDIDTPWDSHLIISLSNQISALEWDQQGRYLLIADSSGDIYFYGSRDYLLNEWDCFYKASFPGEHIIKAAFFHNGRKISLSSDKKSDQTPCTEKFQYLRFAPSVRQFGGVAAEGAIFITATGMVGAVLLPFNNPYRSTRALLVASESLGSTRGYITTADICYGKNGHFLVAVSSGNISHPIQCYRVSVKKSCSLQDEQKPLVVTSQALPSFFLRETMIKDTHCTQIVQVRWASREDTDSLIIAGNGPPGRGACIELWGLVERALPVHSLLVKGSTSPRLSDCFNTVLWQHQCSYRSISAQVVSVTSSKVQIAWSVAGSSLMAPSLPYIFVSLNDNTVHCLHRDTLKQACSASLSQAWSLVDNMVMGGGTPPKQIKFSPMHGGQGSPGPCNSMCLPATLQQPGAAISCCDASWLGGVLLVIDSTSHLYLYKLPQPATDTGTPIAIHHTTTLLEYSMITGFDALDIMMVLKQSSLASIYDRFTESFLRQPTVWQQLHYTKWLCIRAALSRMTISGQARASDLTSLLMLHSISTAFKSLLRPSDLTSHDKGPTESLAAVISEQATPVADIDKALIHLEAKEFAVEPSALQSAQQLIQWAAEVALAAMARLPTSAGTSSAHGYELLRDASALNTMRELLVVVRVWGLLRPHCLPVFTRSTESVDVLSLLYKLLTRLAHNGCEPDEALLEECNSLPSLVLIPQINESLPRTCIVSPMLYCKNLPLQLEFGEEPDMLKYIPDIAPLEGSITSDSCMDSIRHLHLGQRPSAIKRCGRCGAAAARQASQRTTAIRAWDLRWLSACRCGGFWTGE